MTTETTPNKVERFAESLYKLDNGARAQLKRALAQEAPWLYPPVFRYVEPYVREEWERKPYYLGAALFGTVEGEDDSKKAEKRLEFPEAVRRYERNAKGESGDDVSSIEKRFLALLDADQDELPYRLRQIVKMITSGTNKISTPLDWAKLLDDLTQWNSRYKTIQTRWARQFYRASSNPEKEQGDIS